MAEGKKPIKRTTHQVGTPVEKPEPDLTAEEVEPTRVSIFEQLRETIQQTDAEAAEEDFSISVPKRPSMRLMFNTKIDFDTYQLWMRKCENKKLKETDFLRFALIVMSNRTTGILLNGEKVTTPNGEDMTLTSPELHEMIGVSVGGTGRAIRNVFMSDGHVIQGMRLIIEKAGYSLDGDVVEADDEDGPLDI
jgi:hypothetical protein